MNYFHNLNSIKKSRFFVGEQLKSRVQIFFEGRKTPEIQTYLTDRGLSCSLLYSVVTGRHVVLGAPRVS